MKLSPFLIVLFFAISLVFASCHKNNNPDTDDSIDNFLDLKVSESFLFESFTDYGTSIKIDNKKNSDVEIIQIYDEHPNNGGKLILTGSVNEDGVFNIPIRIASSLSKVYVGKLSSNGFNDFVETEIVGSSIQLDFSKIITLKDNNPCTSGCTSTVQGTHNSNFIIASGEIVCIAEGTSASFKKLHIDLGGTLRVCGNVTVIGYKSGSGEGAIVINETGTLTLPKYNIDLTMENYGNLNFTGNGTIQLNGSIENWGDISSTIKMINQGSIVNDDTFITTKEFINNPDATFINNCEFKVNKNGNSAFKQNSDFTNNGYVYVAGTATFSGSGSKITTLGVGSLFETEDFKIQGNIVGPDSQGAQITAEDDGQTSGGASVTGYVDLCVGDNLNPNNATYGPNVTFCDYTIIAPVCDVNIAPTITSSLQLGGLANQAITPYILTATGTETITYSMGALPAGLLWNATTHTITGTPTTVGTYNVDMTATNFMGSDTKTLVIEITQPTAPPVITSVLTDNTTVNQQYTYTLLATGTGPITYGATNLPTGLTFYPATQQIIGIPVLAGTYNINLSATNTGGTTNETLVLTVGTPPLVTSSLVANGTADVQFSTYTFTASGTATLTYSADNLPQGLSFNPASQTINGTPLYAGVTNTTLTVTNSYGTDVQTLVITINEGIEPPIITSSLTANAMKDFPFSYGITADGSQPMTYNATNLPIGLTFNGNTISGIPTVAGTYNITISATNSAGTDTQTLVLVVDTGGGTDTDGDGIPDNLDAYPLDPTRAFNSFYPNETDFGSFAFEDLWPGYGDYDFNDFVVNFNYKIVTNAQNNVVDVITKFQIMADGASLNNGFGIIFDAPSSTVASVTGCMKFGNAVQIDPKGYEMGHTNTTVIIPFDAINPIMEGGMVNTIPGGRYIQTTVNTVTTHFETPQASIGTPPFNPFIFVDQERGHEIHLKNEPPTNLVDPDYFDTYHDVSNPATGMYYISETGLPWAIEVPINFNYPIETADILTAHLKFAAWAQSSGVDFPDWYMDLPGYRNAANIYVIP